MIQLGEIVLFEKKGLFRFDASPTFWFRDSSYTISNNKIVLRVKMKYRKEYYLTKADFKQGTGVYFSNKTFKVTGCQVAWNKRIKVEDVYFVESKSSDNNYSVEVVLDLMGRLV